VGAAAWCAPIGLSSVEPGEVAQEVEHEPFVERQNGPEGIALDLKGIISWFRL